ncbi:hypothetical protein BB559_000185 [Furculomyces boomerangus]|uniref:FACT complex subunit POB3 n=2 Tax=Harpellales TaxID=61421 RepID=A0A2T9XZ29_9FUNG|nr:hypothetical protein BB559_007111 [Furculomyces boomerangus]PVU88971.1 hypothetical protein BB559_005282 [Furculomyces boomerangus]PVV00038.1 hypothetical protein BB559_000185 [Furculomyces boomerangus]PVZ97936.1 hypothetical protein BB558_006087 [Smittium angustum]PWA01821.1 hypothetical protein BB558_002060 [Smittium angustum]
MTEIRTSFQNINLASEAFVFAKGEMRLGQSGIGWKPATEMDTLAAKSSKIRGVSSDSGLLAVQAADIKRIVWMRVARGYGIRIFTSSGITHKLDGFERDSYDDLKVAISKYFHGLNLETRDISVKGWNWGKTEFEGTTLTFKVENKPMFDIPMETVANTNLAGKNEVSIEFTSAPKPVAGVKRKQVDELVEVRFYVPGTVPRESDSQTKRNGGTSDSDQESEISAAQVFYETVKSKADLGQITGNSIVTFSEVLCLTPRGRYTIDMFDNFMRLRGKTYDYKILYDHIKKLFLVTKPDEMHMIFVVELNPPIRQGQTRYPFLVFQLLKDEEKEVVLNISSDAIAKTYKSKIQKRYEEPLYKIITELFSVLAKRQIDEPGNYRTVHGASGAKCSMKANEGFLYPLENGLLFIPKPAQYFSYTEISSIVFSRVGAADSVSSARTFDIIVHTHSAFDLQFSNINREEYTNLFNYLRNNGVKVISDSAEKQSVSYAESDDDEDKSIRKADSDDEDESSVDEDFVAQSDSDVGEEFNEEYNSNNDSE